MRIIIVGGGVGGLSAYHALRKHLIDSNALPKLSSSISITIVESHNSPFRTVGGGIGLAPNGLRAIASIFPSAIPYIIERSFPGPELTFRNAKGNLIGIFKVGTSERYGYDMRMLPRHVVHQALLAGVPEEHIRWGTKVVRVKECGSEIEMEYADGTKEMVDLVIGADGVRSMVKDSLFGGRFEAKYDGLTSVSGFINVDKLPDALQDSLKVHGVTMTFGRKGFFAYGMCSPLPDSQPSFSSEVPPFIQWWSVYECPVIPSRKDIDYSALKSQLLNRHGDWYSPYDEIDSTSVFRRLIELGCHPSKPEHKDDTDTSNEHNRRHDESVMILPRYITPRLPYWSNATSPNTPPETQGRVVLMGDAAHTMPPDVGQGISSTAEDALAYALLLRHYLCLDQELPAAYDPHSPDADFATPFSLAAKAYEELRKPHIHSILDSAKYRGDAKKEVGVIGQFFRDFGMKIASKLPESWKDYVFSYNTEAVVTAYLAGKSEREGPRRWW